jgi:hypothetical protein
LIFDFCFFVFLKQKAKAGQSPAFAFRQGVSHAPKKQVLAIHSRLRDDAARPGLSIHKQLHASAWACAGVQEI